jgi:molybdopterin converting factor small subunit
MQVTVRLEGHLREFFPKLHEPRTVACERPITVAEIIEAVGMAASLPSSVLCNRVRVERDHVPADGDELVLLSPLAGG